MKLNLRRVELNVSFFFAAVVTLMLILDESGIAAVTLASCIAHELGHIFALIFFGESPKSISLEFFGMRIERSNKIQLSYEQEITAAAAGPLLNIVIAMTAGFFYYTGQSFLLIPACSNLALAAFNLIPCEPLDGSRIIYFLLIKKYDEAKTKKIMNSVSVIALFPIAAAGFIVLIRSGYNFSLLAVAAYLTAMLVFRQK